MNVLEFTEEFAALCLQTMKKEDYGDRRKRRLHYAAMEQLRELARQGTASQLESLLDHRDSRVRIQACAACREQGFLMERSVETLRDVIVHEPDTTLKFSASMLLKQYMEN